MENSEQPNFRVNCFDSVPPINTERIMESFRQMSMNPIDLRVKHHGGRKIERALQRFGQYFHEEEHQETIMGNQED